MARRWCSCCHCVSITRGCRPDDPFHRSFVSAGAPARTFMRTASWGDQGRPRRTPPRPLTLTVVAPPASWNYRPSGKYAPAEAQKLTTILGYISPSVPGVGTSRALKLAQAVNSSNQAEPGMREVTTRILVKLCAERCIRAKWDAVFVYMTRNVSALPEVSSVSSPSQASADHGPYYGVPAFYTSVEIVPVDTSSSRHPVTLFTAPRTWDR